MQISSHSRAVQAPKRDWTVLYVLDGDNDLREAATLDLVELNKAGAPENSHFVAQLYRGDLKWNLKNFGTKMKGLLGPSVPSAVQNDWRGMRVFEVGHDGPTVEAAYPRSSESSPSDPQALEDFLAWGMKAYPAENYAVVLSGHGSQEGLLSDSQGEKMPFEQVAQSLKNASQRAGEEIDVVLFDTCSTASQETADKMAGAAKFLVASPKEINGRGWSETATVNFLKANPQAEAREFAESFLSSEHNVVSDPTLYELG